MAVTVQNARALSPEQVRRWSQLQLADRSLASAFFRPEFTQAVASVREDAFVAVLEETDRIVGFFPFHRDALGVGKPIGGRLSDYHGVIAEAGAQWDAESLVRQCGLRAWDFNHLIVSQTPFLRFQDRMASSPYLDLSGGFDAYRQARLAAGSKAVAKIERSASRLARDLGTTRFVAQDADGRALAALFRWKSEQYRVKRWANVLSLPWAVELLKRLQQVREPWFAGMLSTLYVEDRLIAAHMGIRSRDAWHYWFPAYDPTLARYSPGLVLLVEMAKHAEPLGVGVIDLGLGEEPYKDRLMSGAFPLARGSVVVSGPLMAFRRVVARGRAAALRTPLAEPGKVAVRSWSIRAERWLSAGRSHGKRR